MLQPQQQLLQGVLKRGFKQTPFRASFRAAQDTVSCSHALDRASSLKPPILNSWTVFLFKTIFFDTTKNVLAQSKMILSRSWLHDAVSCATWNDARKGVCLKPLFKTPCSNCCWGWSIPIMLDYRDISLMESVPLLWHLPVLNKGAQHFDPTPLPLHYLSSASACTQVPIQR